MSDQQEQQGGTATATPPELVQGDVLTSNERVYFDADAKAADRAAKVYKVGGKVYHPRKRTGRLMKELIQMAPEPNPDAEKTTIPDPDDPSKTIVVNVTTRAEQLASIDLVYQQVAILLVDADGENPDWQELMDELDMTDAQDMIAPLMAGSAGNAPSPQQSS